jgi:galactose mutarotase-like enzyme
MIILENQHLLATLAPKGAELQSLINKQTGIEHMWSGDAAYWGKFSPVLFPIVGGLKNDTYYFEDKTYTLPRHGFAREKIFKAERLNETEAIFTLRHSEETLEVYPFTFTFILRYKLNNNILSCTYEVYNDGIADLLFSVGAHPAFAVPLTKDTDYNDYYLQFNTTEILHRWKLQEGLISASSQLVPVTNNKLLLNKELFYEDAIVLKNMQSNSITLGSNKHNHGLHFSFKGFPFFGIWAAKNAPFVCLEPWCGIADSIDHNQQLINKEGIIALAANTNWQRSWSVECF